MRQAVTGGREGGREGGSENGVESCNGRCRKWKSHFYH